MEATREDAKQITTHMAKSALFERASKNDSVGLFAQFGGQGFSGYFEELRLIYVKHTTLLEPLIEAAEEALKSQLASEDARYEY
jgi:hypothetical protein